tara:strand:+ start:183 stop:1241 length:1059 start_codon:yes stop_codon:yes gene_type:complete
MAKPDDNFTPDPTGQSLWSQLLPFLYDSEEGTMYNPESWLAEYGQYLTPYDPEPDSVIMDSLKLANQDAQNAQLENIENIRAGIGLSGFDGSYLGDRAKLERDKFSLELQANYSNALSEQRAGLQNWQNTLYSDLINLGNMDAFNTENVEQISNQDEIDYWMAGDYLPQREEELFSAPCQCPDGGTSVACCDSYDDIDYSPDPAYNYPGMGSLESMSFEEMQEYYMNNDVYDSEYGANLQSMVDNYGGSENMQDWYNQAYNMFGDCVAGSQTETDLQSCYDIYENSYQSEINTIQTNAQSFAEQQAYENSLLEDEQQGQDVDISEEIGDDAIGEMSDDDDYNYDDYDVGDYS